MNRMPTTGDHPSALYSHPPVPRPLPSIVGHDPPSMISSAGRASKQARVPAAERLALNGSCLSKAPVLRSRPALSSQARLRRPISFAPGPRMALLSGVR